MAIIIKALLSDNWFVSSSINFHFGEQGNYSLWVKNLNELSRVSCSMITDSEPINSYLRESTLHLHAAIQYFILIFWLGSFFFVFKLILTSGQPV